MPGWETFDLQYNEENSRLTFKINKESEIHEVVMRFLKHEDIRIKIDQQITYLLSQTRNFSLVSNSGLQNGKLGLILMENQIIGCMQNCNQSTPIGIVGQWASDQERYILFSSVSNYPFQVFPHPDNTSLMLWQHAGQTGILYHDIFIEPIIKQFLVQANSEGRNQLYWELFLEHLIHGDLARFKYMMVVVQDANGFSQAYPIAQSQNTWIDPILRLSQELNYRLYAVSQDPSYSVAYLGPYFDLTGTQECFTQQGGATLRNKIRTENQDEHSYAIHILPNPFSDVCTFQIYSSESIRGTLMIYGLDGSMIWKAEHFIQQGSNILEIPGGLFPLPGLYYYQWFDGVQSYYGKMQKN
ncbi:MAG: hypothetical protein IPM92_10285 [Saprospiraceae bacterium]|nr:hypothetical protein [Saprospiraceae bacterium]